MAHISLVVALTVSLVTFGVQPATPLALSLQTALDQALPLLSPISPLDEIRACEAARTALRAGAGGADTSFDATGEGFGSDGGGTITSGTAYETSDGWRCETEQTVRGGRVSLEIRIHAPPTAR